MDKMDVYYRGFTEYRKETKDNIDCKKERISLNESNRDLDILNATKYRCTIETDWIEAIEKGLEFVEKAVAEERQFIRVNGEIVPIEKVKKVSKHSVEHLAKHSNMITHLPEDNEKDIVPDNLYVVEKLSDYAVYENRFLYMLLCYLRDFIDYRLEQIDRIRMTYVGNMSFHKEIKTKKRDYFFETRLYEKRIDNPYPIKDDASDGALVRIKNCQQIVNSLLNSNLMVEVSKTPMIKPPITKTNVLKMNNNFKNSLALYEYVASYKGLGYSFEEEKTDFVPLKENVASEIMDIIAMLSFESYKIGNNIEDKLLTAYKEEEKRREEEERAKFVKRIERLKKKAREDQKSMEEYMVLLEMRNQQLLKDIEQLDECKHEIIKLNKVIDELNIEKKQLKNKIDELLNTIEEKVKEIAYLNQKYIDDMAALKKAHEEEIKKLNEDHQNEIEKMIEDHEEEIEAINREHQDEIDKINDEHAEEINSIMISHRDEIDHLNEEHQNVLEQKEQEYLQEKQNIIDDYENKIETLSHDSSNRISELESKVSSLDESLKEARIKRDELINSYEASINDTKDKFNEIINVEKERTDAIINDLTTTNNRLSDENDLYKGELNAIKIKEGNMIPCDDFTSRERFIELEDQFNAFNKYFQEQWKLTKKQIRKEILSVKEVRPEKKKKVKKVKEQKEEVKLDENQESNETQEDENQE